MKTWKRAAGCLCLMVMGWLVISTAGWPFMGDATYIHYVVFLTQKGWHPYRDIVEMNMPGAYLIEQAAMWVFGGGAAGWRIFDFALMAAAIWGCSQVLRAESTMAGLCAGVFFAVIHTQDGVMMAGQRDFIVAVCEVLALACLQKGLEWAGLEPAPVPAPSPRSRLAVPALLWPFAFGLFSALAICVKPPSAFFLGAVLVWLVLSSQSRLLGSRSAIAALAGAVVPPTVCAAYLLKQGALRAFWAALHGIVWYHAQLERKPISFLLTHAFSPILILFVLYLGTKLAGTELAATELVRKKEKHASMQLLLKHFPSRCRPGNILLAPFPAGKSAHSTNLSDHSNCQHAIALCAAAGWLSYFVQGKGFSYQRYPFLVFLLLLIFSSMFSALASRDRLRWLGYASASAAFAMVLFFCHRIAGYSHADPFTALSADLQALGGQHLSGSVQCMDTAGGCIAALYHERLLQSTGFIYDCYFEDASSATAQSLRRDFEAAMRSHPPRAFIITDSVCFGQPRSFDKFAAWPAFTEALAHHYRLVQQRRFTAPVRYWSRADLPFSYRIYIRNP